MLHLWCVARVIREELPSRPGPTGPDTLLREAALRGNVARSAETATAAWLSCLCRDAVAADAAVVPPSPRPRIQRRGHAAVWRPYAAVWRPYADVWRPYADVWRPYAAVWRPYADVWRPYAAVWRPYAATVSARTRTSAAVCPYMLRHTAAAHHPHHKQARACLHTPPLFPRACLHTQPASYGSGGRPRCLGSKLLFPSLAVETPSGSKECAQRL